jgi:hypothetical protein
MSTTDQQKQKKRQQQMLYFMLLAQLPQLVYDVEDARGPGNGPAKKKLVLDDLTRLAESIAPESARTPRLIKWVSDGVDIFVADAKESGALPSPPAQAPRTD